MRGNGALRDHGRAAYLVIRNALGTALWLGLALLAGLSRLLEELPDRFTQGLMELSADLAALTTWRGRLAGLGLLAVLITLPAWAAPATLTVMISALWFAYAGQSWNLLAGFAGRYSLGHSLFVGLGAYLSAALFLNHGLSPWLGVMMAVPAVSALGALLGLISARASLGTVSFALITLVGAELGRLATGSLTWFGGEAGLILSPPPLPGQPPPIAPFYYLILAMTGLALVLCRLLTRSAAGYRWRAVRDDPAAAAAAGVDVESARISALAASAALAAPAGVFQAFYAGALGPDQLFAFDRSVELLLGPALGGLGTLFGPVIGAFVVSPLGDALNDLAARSPYDLSALRPFCSGLLLVLLALSGSGGLWPWLARRFALTTATLDPIPTETESDDDTPNPRGHRP